MGRSCRGNRKRSITERKNVSAPIISDHDYKHIIKKIFSLFLICIIIFILIFFLFFIINFIFLLFLFIIVFYYFFHSSFFQSVCTLGYCLLPLTIAVAVSRLLLTLPVPSSAVFIIRLVIVGVALFWSVWGKCKFF